jgi:hypothetical protein
LYVNAFRAYDAVRSSENDSGRYKRAGAVFSFTILAMQRQERRVGALGAIGRTASREWLANNPDVDLGVNWSVARPTIPQCRSRI